MLILMWMRDRDVRGNTGFTSGRLLTCESRTLDSFHLYVSALSHVKHFTLGDPNTVDGSEKHGFISLKIAKNTPFITARRCKKRNGRRISCFPTDLEVIMSNKGFCK